MVYKTYISKFATIVSNSKINTGLNPVSELVYGRDTIVSRALFYFDHNKVKQLIDDGIMVDKSKMKHTLRLLVETSFGVCLKSLKISFLA